MNKQLQILSRCMKEEKAARISKLDIPREYNSLVSFIEANKRTIYTDWRLLLEIVKVLDNMLGRAESMGDLRQDMSVMLYAIRLLQDSLLRAYRNNMSVDKLVSMANDGHLESFLEMVKSKSLACSFVDRLVLAHSPEERREARQRTVYDTVSTPAVMPTQLLAESAESCGESEIARRIQTVVMKAGMVEYFALIIDPGSFSQTVYNAFNCALALRSKLVSCISRDNKIYIVPYRRSGNTMGHSVFSITPAQFRAIVSLLNIKEPML